MPLHFLESAYALETANFNIPINSLPQTTSFVIPTETLENIVQNNCVHKMYRHRLVVFNFYLFAFGDYLKC